MSSVTARKRQSVSGERQETIWKLRQRYDHLPKEVKVHTAVRVRSERVLIDAISALSLSANFVLAGAKFAGEVLAVGFPLALNTLFVCVSIMVTNTLTAAHGDIPLAAIGIVKKVEMLPHNVGTGLCQGMIPLIAYNYASGNYKRMNATIHTARAYGAAFTVFCIVIF